MSNEELANLINLMDSELKYLALIKNSIKYDWMYSLLGIVPTIISFIFVYYLKLISLFLLFWIFASFFLILFLVAYSPYSLFRLLRSETSDYETQIQEAIKNIDYKTELVEKQLSPFFRPLLFLFLINSLVSLSLIYNGYSILLLIPAAFSLCLAYLLWSGYRLFFKLIASFVKCDDMWPEVRFGKGEIAKILAFVLLAIATFLVFIWFFLNQGFSLIVGILILLIAQLLFWAFYSKISSYMISEDLVNRQIFQLSQLKSNLIASTAPKTKNLAIEKYKLELFGIRKYNFRFVKFLNFTCVIPAVSYVYDKFLDIKKRN